jgi:hypothetical protein
MDDPNHNLQHVIETTGLDILSFLGPKDLVRLASINLHFHQKAVHQFVFAVCTRSLQSSSIKLGVGTNYLAEFKIGRSFKNKTELWDFIFSRITPTDAILDICRTVYGMPNLVMEEALQLLRTEAEEQSNINKRGERNSLITASCNTQERNPSLALRTAQYFLDRDACKKGKGKEKYHIVLDWLKYLMRLRDIAIEYWEWDMLHNNRRQFGKGLVFMSRESGEEYIEFRLNRLY